MSKIKDFNLQEGEVDYCIKKTMSEEKDLDIGNLLFMFKLYENIENYSLTKNNPVLIKKTKIQIMKNDNKIKNRKVEVAYPISSSADYQIL